MTTTEALFNAPIPVRLTLDDIILIVTALDHHRQICEAAAEITEAARYETILSSLEQATQPALMIMGQADDHLNSSLRQ